MSNLRKWWKTGAAVAAALVILQLAVSLLVRTHRMHTFLVTHLERAVGRPVQVESFGARIFPNLQFSADGVTVGEDPAFGYEYFLRAERLSAGLRWMGLLRGHFEFGTLSFSKPSLILVRNGQGQWNLERWLPPTKTTPSQNAATYGPPSPILPVNHLQRIVFDDGRINFKVQDDKLPFAFTGVSGSFEQVSQGRWQLQLEAQPWRSGVPLQSTGTIRVRGDLAGTSARLQPAQITLHWSEGSLADIFRLAHGQDYGVRGLFTLDAAAKSDGVAPDAPGDWTYSVQAHARQIHRWDLSERPDNPALNVNVNGHWNSEAGSLLADQFSVEGLRSNLRGKFRYVSENPAATELRLDSMGVQASDLLAWYRAFHPDVAEGITADPYFTGGMILHGWPLSIESAALSSNGGMIKVPGFAQPVRIGPVNGGLERSNLVIGPMRVALSGDARDVIAPKRRRVAQAMENAADLTFTQDLKTDAGDISIEGDISKVEDFLKLAVSLGRPVNHGWELTGHATAVTQWAWKEPFKGRWNGAVEINRGMLTVAGLNQPLSLPEARLGWNDGQHEARLLRVEGFGGNWQGNIEENRNTQDDTPRNWKFDLMVDHLNAAELDRWVGPRARPSWLQRLLHSFSGDAAPATPASELVRRVDAEGRLRIGRLTIEKLKLENVIGQGSLRDLKLSVPESAAEWAGGRVRAKINASFLPHPVYEVSADLDRVNLAKLPGTGRLAEGLNGSASGNLQLKTAGVGREELLTNLDGSGAVNLKKVELRGWDLPASVADGATRAGVSRWPAGECAFLIRNRSVVLQWLQLNDPREQTSVEGTLTFGSDAELSVSTQLRDAAKVRPKKASAKGHVLRISGPLDGLRVTVEKTPEPPQVAN
ncbi:MAG TPA: AsmA family protein [Candidatus Acidoferrum sp.]|nr:AsmA family protein [Candidatus Acidoferrum sp.]